MSVAFLQGLPLLELFFRFFTDISLHCDIRFRISYSLLVQEIPCPLLENYPGLMIQ